MKKQNLPLGVSKFFVEFQVLQNDPSLGRFLGSCVGVVADFLRGIKLGRKKSEPTWGLMFFGGCNREHEGIVTF